ncbi:hypothetical protein N657DRAFT_578456 [Parathielavia appendiculata]|uniref:Uncharacterized protein n=1 Tax=Parathielavia appendiculata TaxID=2587402 RepID=A0AAN6Z101_9PEZI|nr:hypothetical protein N657DRAFT_578456 [Parathielavia appendiculata]
MIDDILFYNGLKDEGKDELNKIDRPDTLNRYTAMAIRIDNRVYIYKLYRKGKGAAAPIY